MYELAIILWFFSMATLLLGLRGAPYGEDGKQHLVSAHGLVITMFLIFLILPAFTPVFLSASDLTWAPAFSGYKNIVAGLILVWASLFIFLISYWIFQPVRQELLRNTNRTQSINAAGVIGVVLGLVGLGVLLKLITVQLGGGLEMTILRMSGGVAENVGISRTSSGLLQQMRSISIIADLAASWLFVFALIQKRWRLAAFVLLIVVVALTMATTGKRLYTFWPLMVLAISLSYFYLRIRPHHFLVVVTVTLLLGWASLSYRIYAPLYYAGALESFDIRAVPWAQGSTWRFYFNSLEFSYFDFTVVALKSREPTVSLFNGQLEMIYKTQIEPLSYIVPRAIWPYKPDSLLDISHGLASLVFYEDIDTIGLGVASSLTGTAWLSGGIFGVVVAFVFLGFVASKCDEFFYSSAQFEVSPVRVLIYAFMLMVVFHLFRQGTFGWVFIIVVVQQLGGIIAFLVIWFATSIKIRRTL